jgi:hypothetical protein
MTMPPPGPGELPEETSKFRARTMSNAFRWPGPDEQAAVLPPKC